MRIQALVFDDHLHQLRWEDLNSQILKRHQVLASSFANTNRVCARVLEPGNVERDVYKE